MCKTAFSHAPSVPSQKFLTHARKTFLKIPRENIAWPGTSMHACAGSVLLAQLCSHQVYAGETSSRSRKVSGLVPVPPSRWAAWKEKKLQPPLGDSPAKSPPPQSQGRPRWEHVPAHPTDASLGTAALQFEFEQGIGCLGTPETISKL